MSIPTALTNALVSDAESWPDTRSSLPWFERAGTTARGRLGPTPGSPARSRVLENEVNVAGVGTPPAATTNSGTREELGRCGTPFSVECGTTLQSLVRQRLPDIAPVPRDRGTHVCRAHHVDRKFGGSRPERRARHGVRGIPCRGPHGHAGLMPWRLASVPPVGHAVWGSLGSRLGGHVRSGGRDGGCWVH